MLMPLSEYDLDNMDLTELSARIEEFQKEVAEIDLENELLERYLEKNDPELLVGIQMQLAKQKAPARIKFAVNAKRSVDTTHSAGNFSRRESLTSTIFDTISIGTAASFARSARTLDSQQQEMRVGYGMRTELCNKEAAVVMAETDRIQGITKLQCRELIAEIEELRLTNDEVIETRREFKEFVLVNGAHPLTKRVPSERFQKFFDKWTRNGNAMVENFRMRTTTLKRNSVQMKLALTVKAELSSILRPVDFEKLEIETEQLQKEIEQKTIHVLALKRTTGNGSLALSMQRKQLLNKEAQLKRLLADQERVRKLTLNYEVSSDNAVKDIARWTRRKEKLNEKMLTYEAPTILDYMNRKQELTDLDKQVKALTRSYNITLIKLKNAKIMQRKRQVAAVTQQATKAP